jgi:hypothetical protein
MMILQRGSCRQSQDSLPPDEPPLTRTYWLEMFPDEASRPARHMLRTELPVGLQLQLEIMAVLGQG